MRLRRKHIFLFFIFIIFSLSNYAEVYAQEVTIAADGLNIRSGPGEDYDVVGQVNTGEIFQLIEEKPNWIAISYNSQTVWVAAEYVSLSPETGEETDQSEEVETTEENIVNVPEEQNTIKNAMTKFQETNVRSQPSTAGDILTTLGKGEVISTIQSENDWLEIEWDNTTGYVPSWVIGDVSPIRTDATSVFQNKVIVLDAGHGGRDVGAIGASGNYEKDYTLRTAKMVKSYLEQLGATVYLTRDDDHYYTLTSRAAFSNYQNADMFLSLHYNSTPQYPNAAGISTYYYNESDAALADIVHTELLKSLLAEDRQTNYGDYQVIRTNHRPSLLLELGFISNVEEESKIQTLSYQKKIAQGIIAGLQRYYSYNE
ncbi:MULTISPECIES: N-acetylmuramoyl-L-alanine amidase [Paraliobacillus]|uniref:N-acetylmuramoyl-L-alanine amidase n=1 Tax=Paraliobacillus TaxID=200903 RepID=UPI000DD2F491|nr:MULTISPECIES: N-acetylmuramoyl-L-alanine amidase [Paraliobacillus]